MKVLIVNSFSSLVKRVKAVAFLQILAMLLFVSSSYTLEKCPKHPNKYGLNIVYCKEDYKKQVKRNPNFELVNIGDSIKGLNLDIRYATTNNFTKQIIYTQPKAYVRRPVYEALKKAQDSLAFHGLGLKIFDAYRPYAASEKFYQVYPDTNFVANPKYGSRHNRGCAVDVSLVNLKSGNEIPMPTEFDDFSDKASPNNMNLPEEVIKNRTFLFSIMAHFGFTHNPNEWWHFDYLGWNNYPLMDLPFEVLGN